MTQCKGCGILERVSYPFLDGYCWHCVRERERGANMQPDVDTPVGRPEIQLHPPRAVAVD